MTTNTADAPKIPLKVWAATQFAKVPHITTLRRWANEGHIQPQPELVGREYLVQPNAQYRRKTK